MAPSSEQREWKYEPLSDQQKRALSSFVTEESRFKADVFTLPQPHRQHNPAATDAF